MRAFISCASENIKIAEKLEKELKEQHVSPWIYTKCLRPGQVLLQEIDKVLAEADYTLGIITEEYLSSIGGVEAYSKIFDGLQKKDIRFIPLFFIPPEKVESVIIKSIKGINFTADYEKGLYELIKFIKSEEPESAKILLSEVERPESPNPFRRVRAEFFRDDYELLAKAFATPEKEKYDLLLEDKPIFIFGGRGCGKTMLLKSLTPRVHLSRLKVNTYSEAREKGVNFLGIYLRLEKGSLLIYDCNNIIEMGFIQTGLSKDYEQYKQLLKKVNKEKYLSPQDIEEEPVLTAGFNAGWAITLNEMNFKILIALLNTLIDLAKTPHSIITLEKPIEKTITEEILEKLDVQGVNITNFQELIKFIDKELLKLSNYIQDLSTPYAKPEVNWCRTGIKFLDQIFQIIANNINELNGITFYLLFDEFENLRPFQQTILIEWVKTATYFVPKIASKFEGMYTNLTLQGQPLQFGEDCPPPIELDYDLFNQSSRKKYQELLSKICYNLLEIEGYTNKDIREILETPKTPEIAQDEVDKEIKKVRDMAGLEYIPEKIEDYRNKLQVAAIFRLLRERRKVEGRKGRKKIYAGFETYTYLSSGMIRIFLNLMGMALYKAEEEGITVKEGKKIPVEHQTGAAYIVSNAWLEKIPKNYDFGEYGERIYQFIVDIGDLLKERLI